MSKTFIFVNDGVIYTIARDGSEQCAVQWLDDGAADGVSSVYVGIDATGFYYGASADIHPLLAYDGTILHIVTVDAA